MTDLSVIEKRLSYFGSELSKKIAAESVVKEISKGEEIIKTGQHIKVVPILLSGLLKVVTRHEDKELLLYYIQPFESCIMSFSASLKNETSKIAAIAEENCTLLLMPSAKVNTWMNDYPQLNRLFYQQYDLRYNELIETINHLVFDKLETRIYDHLKEKTRVTGKNPVKISHRELALELGTAREVVSRLVKRLEKDGKLHQNQESIEVL